MHAFGRRSQGLGIVFLSLALLAPRLMAAEVTVANQLQGYYDSKVKESLLDDRLDALARQGPFSIGATLISHSPSDYSVLDPNNLGPELQGIRKRWVQAESGGSWVRLGHSYTTFGRGLALQIFEDQSVAFDNVLDGISGEGSTGGWHAQVIGGTNAYGPKAMILKGASAGRDLPYAWKSGIEGVWADYTEADGKTRTGGDRLYGGHLGGGVLGRIDLYGEYVMRDRANSLGRKMKDPQGHAGYANMNLNLGAVQLLTEYKELLRYNLPKIPKEDGTEQAWVNPPTAVRQHQTTLLNRGSHVAFIDFADERGLLAESYITLREKTHATLSYSHSDARHEASFGGVYPNTRFPAWETYGDIEHWFGERTELIVRLDEAEETVIDGVPTFFERITGGASLTFPLSENWSLYNTWESQETQQTNKALTPEDYFYTDYKDHVIGVTLSKAPSMSWALNAEWTTKKSEAHDFWLWGEFGTRVGERHQVTIGYGRLRGGQVCSGGVCRIVDPFEGGRVEITTSF